MLQTLKNLHKTFYDSHFYHNLVCKWAGLGFSFLVIISAIQTAQLVIFIKEPYEMFMQERESIFAALPAFEIRNGKILSDNEAPVTITMLKGMEGGPVRIVIDTDKDMTDMDATAKRMETEQIFALVNGNAISIYSPDDKKIVPSYAKDMRNTKITHEQWQDFKKNLESTFMPMTIVSVFALYVMGNIGAAFLGAVLLFVISPLFKINVDFRACMRLASAALLPMAIVFLVVMPQISLQALLWFGFAIFGLFSAKKGGDPTPQLNA